jgi:putative PIN family toxin of toxin-antitoxin system
VGRLKNRQISACIDANVFISGVAFGGKPLKIIERALNREFLLITGTNILQEVQRNLLKKLEIQEDRVERFIADISEIASVFVPNGNLNITVNHGDNLVLEVAMMGGADVLVTGDKRHLLPLQTHEGIIIEPPSAFLSRLDRLK